MSPTAEQTEERQVSMRDGAKGSLEKIQHSSEAALADVLFLKIANTYFKSIISDSPFHYFFQRNWEYLTFKNKMVKKAKIQRFSLNEKQHISITKSSY